MIFLIGQHPLRDSLQSELARRGVSSWSADALEEFHFTVAMDASGNTRAGVTVGVKATTLKPSDGIANFLQFTDLASEDFCITEQWAAWWAFLDAAPCRVWNGPSRMGFPAPVEDLAFAALLSEGGWTIPVIEATPAMLSESRRHSDASLRDIVTGGPPDSLDDASGVLRRTRIDPHTTRHLLWVAGQMCDIASPSDYIDDCDLVDALAPIATVLSRQALGAALIVVQQNEDGTPALLAVRAATASTVLGHKQQFAVRAIVSYLMD